MRIEKRVLIQTLSASLVFTLVLSVMFFTAVDKLRGLVRADFGEMGTSAGNISAAALEGEVTGSLTRTAQDMALLLDERLLKIENHTRTTADIAGSIYSHRSAWQPKPLPRVFSGEIPPEGPYVHVAPGIDLARIKNEIDLAGNIGDVLRQITVTDRGITTSAIGSESGFIVAMDSTPWTSTDFDPRLYPWYQGAKETGSLYWSGVYLDLRGRGPAFSCAVPFYDSSSGSPLFRGVARSTVILSGFSQVIDSVGIGQGGYLFLLDDSALVLFRAGNVVVTEENGRLDGKNFLKSGDPRLASLGQSMTLGAAGMTELAIDGRQAFVAYAPIKTLGWSLGVAIPVAELTAPARRIGERIGVLTVRAKASVDRHMIMVTGIIAALLLASLGTIAFFSVRFTRALTRPILALNEGVREVSGGSLNREVQIKTGDELEQLADSFNLMTGRLRAHIAEIERATAEKERITTELNIAERIQLSMLPADFPPYPGRRHDFDLFASIHPAKEVGGDFYDFFFIDDDRFALLIADVSGKGVPAALFMAITKALIKNQIRSGKEPDLALESVNRQLCDGNSEGMFVTLWLGILELSSGRLRYINAGHNAPLLKKNGGTFAFFTSPPDLVLAAMDDTVYTQRETVLDMGDVLFLYTDGINEAAAADGSFYGNERLRAFMERNSALDQSQLLEALRADIESFSAGTEQSDDITMLILRRGVEKKSDSGGAPTSAAALLSVKADVSNLEKLIAFIGGGLDSNGCPPKIRGQIELAAEEVFVNIARYAYRLRPEAPSYIFDVEISRTIARDPENPDSVLMTLIFSDSGSPFNPLEHAEPDVSAELPDRNVGGLGILIVKRTMDSVRYERESGANRLVIKKSWLSNKEGA